MFARLSIDERDVYLSESRGRWSKSWNRLRIAERIRRIGELIRREATV